MSNEIFTFLDPDSFLCRFADIFDGVVVTAPTAGAVVALALAVLLLYCSGFVSASEIAFFSLSPSDLSQIEEEEHPADKRISELLEQSERLLATILILNNLVNVTIIMLLNYFFAAVIDFGTSEILEFIAITVVLTFLLLLFGEIMPKVYSAQHSLSFARRAAPVIGFLGKLCNPLANVLVHSGMFIDKLAQKRAPTLSVDELSQALELTDKSEISEESPMLEGIIRFGEETAKSVMTSRLDMVDLEIDTPFPEVLECVVENAYSRIPVYEESRDNIKGVLYIKDLLPYLKGGGSDFRWQNLIRPAFFVPETKKIDDLLHDFQANKVHIAIVVDEFGGTSGIVTMEDIIEEIVGEIRDEYDEEERLYSKAEDGSYIFEAKILLSDFYKVMKIDPEDFDDAAGDADTLAGMLLELKGEFPSLHESMQYGGLTFEVLAMDVRRILKVKVTVNADAAAQGQHKE